MAKKQSLKSLQIEIRRAKGQVITNLFILALLYAIREYFYEIRTVNIGILCGLIGGAINTFCWFMILLNCTVFKKKLPESDNPDASPPPANGE